MEHSGHIIELSDAVALLGDFPALAGADLTVSKGEVVCVEGPNGAGKSTLLRLCAGLLPLYTGSGLVLGKNLSDRDQRRQLRRQAGLLAHETFLYDELSVIDNITFWAKANRSDLSTIDPVLDRLGLDGRLKSVKARDLSAGQRRRTSLAIMISRRPHIWLLDEPHAALDKKGKDAVDALIGQAIGFGATVLLASHDYERARAVATRVVQVAGGRVVDAGDVDTAGLAVAHNERPQGESPEPSPPVPTSTATSNRPVTKGFVNSVTVNETVRSVAPLQNLGEGAEGRVVNSIAPGDVGTSPPTGTDAESVHLEDGLSTGGIEAGSTADQEPVGGSFSDSTAKRPSFFLEDDGSSAAQHQPKDDQ